MPEYKSLVAEPEGGAVSKRGINMLPVEEAKKRGAEVGVPEEMAEFSVFRMLLRHPPLAAAMYGLLAELMFRNELDARLRELVILRIGWRSGSVYEWTQHWRISRALEIPEEHLLAVRDWESSEVLGEADKAVLAAVDETLDTGAVAARTWDACARHLSSEALLELVTAIGHWRLYSSLLRTLQVPLEDGVEAWPPDGRRPSE